MIPILAHRAMRLVTVLYCMQEAPMTTYQEVLPENGLHAAQRYLESLLDSGQPLSPGEMEEIQQSIEAIRRGNMTLAEFERKHGV